MDTLTLETDINVFYVTASSFPVGIESATKKLHQIVPFSKERNFFGLSRPENGGEIIYRAAAEALYDEEAEAFKCDNLVIKKRIYRCLIIDNFRQDLALIQKAFQLLLATPRIDLQGYCVEWYNTEKESVTCMVRLEG